MRHGWKTFSGKRIESIADFVRDATREGQTVHVGCDSLQTTRFTQFVTVVVILNPPHGGRVAYYLEVVPRIKSLRQRLLEEVWHSVRVAMDLQYDGELTIHIDANSQTKHLSSKYLEELVGLVVGQGFKALYKPHAYVATCIADHLVRHCNVRVPRRAA